MFRTKQRSRRREESGAARAPRPPRRQSRNLAARMGRWSADHWKTATFGWLAFVVVAFALGGMVGTKNVDPNAPGPGESGRMDRILDAGFKQPAGESVLIQSRSLSRERSRLHRRDRRRRRAALEARRPSRTSARRSRPATRARSPRTGTRRSSSSRSAATRTRRSTRSTRSSTRSTRRSRPIRASSSASSATRARSRRSRRRSADDLGEGRAALAPDHADHPRDRVRRARGGGHPAAARADRRLRDLRADRAAQPHRCRWRRRPARSCS